MRRSSQDLQSRFAICTSAGLSHQGGTLVLNTDAGDVGIGAVLEQEQEYAGQVVKRVIAYASKTLTDSQRRYCTTNKELLALVMAVELFRYYLTGRHFTVVTDHASLTWLHNFREPEGMVARWISRLQPFDFAIVHRPGKHHTQADGLSCRTSRICKRDTCPECKPLQKTVIAKAETARCYTPAFPISATLTDRLRCLRMLLPCFGK